MKADCQPAKLLALALSLSAFGSLSAASAAQDATPAVYPATPQPAECVVAPRPAEEIVDLATGLLASPAASPEPFEIPPGQPADDATAAAVTATLRQVFACANAGDPLRFASLFSDDFVRAFFAGVPRDQLMAFLSAPPQPLPDEERRIIIRFGEVQLHPDGRAGVVIVLDEPDDPRTEEPDYAVLEQVDGRWLVAEIHEDGGAG